MRRGSSPARRHRSRRAFARREPFWARLLCHFRGAWLWPGISLSEEPNEQLTIIGFLLPHRDEEVVMSAKQAGLAVKAERRSSRERAAPNILDPSDTPARSRVSVKAAGATAPASIQTPGRQEALAARVARGDQDPLARRLADAEAARDEALRSEEFLAEALRAEVHRADGAEASSYDAHTRERAAVSQ